MNTYFIPKTDYKTRTKPLVYYTMVYYTSMIRCRYNIQNTCFQLICVYYMLFILGLRYGILYRIRYFIHVPKVAGILYNAYNIHVKKHRYFIRICCIVSILYRVRYFIQVIICCRDPVPDLRILYTGTNQPYIIQIVIV